MTIHQSTATWSVQATEDLSVATARFHAVSFAGLVVASSSRAAGILITSTKSGDQATIVREGVQKVAVGATVTTLGYPLKITTSGWLIAAASGDTHIGRALTAAASGDLIPAFIDFNTMPAWAGT